MKNRRYRNAALLGSLIFSLGTFGLQAQEERPAPPPPAERPAPDAAKPEAEAKARPGVVRGERIRQRIRDLNAAGKHDEAKRLTQRLRQAEMKQAGRPAAQRQPNPERLLKAEGPPAGRPDAAPRRKDGPPPPMHLMHLKQAAEHLQAAGYPEHAQKAREEIGRISAEMKRAEESQRREMQRRKTDENRRDAEIKRRAAAADDLREEMGKMRREMEEMRQQLRRMKAGPPPRQGPQRRDPAPPAGEL